MDATSPALLIGSLRDIAGNLIIYIVTVFDERLGEIKHSLSQKKATLLRQPFL